MTALRQGLSAERFEEIYPLLQSGRPVLLPSDFPIFGEGITALQVPQRYSADQLAPHIIGYINGEGRGICGIESGYEEQLTRWGGALHGKCLAAGHRAGPGGDRSHRSHGRHCPNAG